MSKDVAVVLAESVGRVAALGGKAIEAKNPKKAVEALEMLATGSTYREVVKKTGVTWDQLIGLKARHAKGLVERRAQLAYDGFEMAEGVRMLAKEKMRMLADDPEALEKVNIRDLAITGAVYQDKAFAALGEVGGAEEKRDEKKALSLEDAVKIIEAARANLKRVGPGETGPVVDVEGNLEEKNNESDKG